MKKTTISALLLALCLLFVCCSCGTQGGGSGNTNNADTELTPPEISELAMDNFVKKLQAGNYSVTGMNGVVTNAVSPQQVYFVYPHEGYPTIYAYMTHNGETFAAMIENDQLDEAEFLSTSDAITAAGKILPNYWIEITGNSMFELFYNSMEKPLEFTSNDDSVKYTLCCLGGYGEFALSAMEEVHMVMDARDPSSVRFTAAIPDPPNKMYHYDDLDITLKFGAAESEPHVETWVKDPVYPRTRTGWTKDDVAVMDNVFMRGYGSSTVPFPAFASYALNFDQKAYDEFLGIRLTDAHATEQNVEEYKALLLSSGYTEVAEKQDDGSTLTVYRKLLRDKYHAYAELYPSFENGFSLVGVPYYEDPYYEGLPAISEAMQEHGFAALKETDLFTGWSAKDEAASRSEGFAYFFDYDFYMPFMLSFSDAEAARAYWDDYCEQLPAKGFEETFAVGENRREFKTADGAKCFRYSFYDDTVTLEVKSEPGLSTEEANRLIAEHGIPAANLSGNIGARDQSRYRYEISGFTGLLLTATQQFESSEKAEQFLNSYTAVLDEQGYLIIDPQKLASNREYVFFNEDLAKYVGFDYHPGENGASVLFEFFSAEPEEETMMQSALRR